MPSSGCMRSSSGGSRRKRCCRRPRPRRCCSGRCWRPGRSRCARSTDGRPWPSCQLPLPCHLTWQLDRNKSSPLEKRRSGQFHTHRDGTLRKSGQYVVAAEYGCVVFGAGGRLGRLQSGARFSFTPGSSPLVNSMPAVSMAVRTAARPSKPRGRQSIFATRPDFSNAYIKPIVTLLSCPRRYLE